MGPELIWTLPSGLGGSHFYTKNDPTDIVRFSGPATMWLSDSGSQQLTSRFVLSFTPEQSNSTIQCGNVSVSKTLTYITASMYLL